MNAPRGKRKWPQTVWVWSNYGRVIGVAGTRAQARKDAAEWAGYPWPEIADSVEVWKGKLAPVKKPSA